MGVGYHLPHPCSVEGSAVVLTWLNDMGQEGIVVLEEAREVGDFL